MTLALAVTYAVTHVMGAWALALSMGAWCLLTIGRVEALAVPPAAVWTWEDEARKRFVEEPDLIAGLLEFEVRVDWMLAHKREDADDPWSPIVGAFEPLKPMPRRCGRCGQRHEALSCEQKAMASGKVVPMTRAEKQRVLLSGWRVDGQRQAIEKYMRAGVITVEEARKLLRRLEPEPVRRSTVVRDAGLPAADLCERYWVCGGCGLLNVAVAAKCLSCGARPSAP